MTALHYNDAGTWRAIQQAWYNDAGTWRQFWSAVTFTVNANNVASVGDTSIQNSFINAESYVQLLTTGGLENGGNSGGGGTWGTPVGGTPGATHWVRATLTAGSIPNLFESAALNSWIQISSLPFWGNTRAHTNLGTTTSTLTLDIATDSGGSNIVSTRTGLIISATITV
jgi:hypothetical protein